MGIPDADAHGGGRRRRSRREAALERLPAAYAFALRLRDGGMAEDLIAARLAVEPEALGPLLDLAEAKLATLLDAGQETTPCEPT